MPMTCWKAGGPGVDTFVIDGLWISVPQQPSAGAERNTGRSWRGARRALRRWAQARRPLSSQAWATASQAARPCSGDRRVHGMSEDVRVEPARSPRQFRPLVAVRDHLDRRRCRFLGGYPFSRSICVGVPGPARLCGYLPGHQLQHQNREASRRNGFHDSSSLSVEPRPQPLHPPAPRPSSEEYEAGQEEEPTWYRTFL